MTKRKPKSAAAFSAELNADAEYVARRSAREDTGVLREAEFQVLTQALRDDLAAVGYPVATIEDLLPRYAPLPQPVVDALLKHLAEMADISVQEHIVRVLGASAVSFDGAPLVRLFEASDSTSVRFAVANTLAQRQARGVAEWVLGAVQNPAYGVARQMLALAAARLASPEAANPVLVSLLDELPGHAAMALAESGQHAELQELETKYGSIDGWARKEVGRAISVIRRRLGSA